MDMFIVSSQSKLHGETVFEVGIDIIHCHILLMFSFFENQFSSIQRETPCLC